MSIPSGHRPRSSSEAARRVLRRSPAQAVGRRPARVCLALALIVSAATVAHAGDLAVVAHPSVPMDDMSFAEFTKVILGERQYWAAGQPITLIVRAAEAEERTRLLEQVYRMSEAQYRQYWVAKVFRAEATSAPQVVLSNAEAVDLVGVIEGAISVVSVEDVPEGIKVLRIDGKLPGDEGYRFE